MSNQTSAVQQDQWLKVADEAARLAGGILSDWVGKFAVREKSRANLVTKQTRRLKKQSPDISRQHFRTTDSSVKNLNQPADESIGSWIIDPLDGTSNYVHGFRITAFRLHFDAWGDWKSASSLIRIATKVSPPLPAWCLSEWKADQQQRRNLGLPRNGDG